MRRWLASKIASGGDFLSPSLRREFLTLSGRVGSPRNCLTIELLRQTGQRSGMTFAQVTSSSTTSSPYTKRKHVLGRNGTWKAKEGVHAKDRNSLKWLPQHLESGIVRHIAIYDSFYFYSEPLPHRRLRLLLRAVSLRHFPAPYFFSCLDRRCGSGSECCCLIQENLGCCMKQIYHWK